MAVLSLIVPTRSRTRQLAKLLESLVEMTSDVDRVEVVLVVDNDDLATRSFSFPGLRLVRVFVEPGQTMGELNMTGYEVSSGRYIMLLNDDVVVRTKHWDKFVLKAFRRFPDQIAMIHVNDMVFQEKLCTFPIVSREFCDFAGGICPRQYRRYRIDDHIEDIFTLLWYLGEQRIVYLPDVVFEHNNYVENVPGLRQYFSDEHILTRFDAPLFNRLTEHRKAVAVKLKRYIDADNADNSEKYQHILASVSSSSDLRDPGRLLLRRTAAGRLRCAIHTVKLLPDRILTCARQRGVGGLLRAVLRRIYTATSVTDPSDI
jgi:glycosyltransferase involved in cell wall biosynthesis